MRFLSTSFIENFRMAFNTLRSNKLRSFLTIFGVIIGVITVMLISSIISGINVAVEKEVESFGTRSIFLYKMDIGIRKALGAKQSDILKQFLFEAGTLAAIGGIVGLIIAKLIGFVVSAFLIQTIIPIWAAILAIGVSAFVGICAGLYPAWKAARLDPIEALRAD